MADIAASLRYPGYSYVDDSVSELSAIGAPTRPFVVGVDLLTILLEPAFAVGVWRWSTSATIAAAFAFGVWAGTYAPQVAANLPTSGLGLIERVNVYSFYLWLALLMMAPAFTGDKLPAQVDDVREIRVVPVR